MISRQEIMDFSREWGLTANVVEKDYMLGWILAGIANRDALGMEWALIRSTLEKKCEFKGISVPTMAILENKPERAELEAEWENMLAHQLPVLPPFEQFWQELPEVFDWLYRAVEKVTPPELSIRGVAVDETWRAPAMAQAWHTSFPLETIRFAAANRLCVDLDYIDEKGIRKNPRIEPYSLRKTRDGNLLLYVVKHETGQGRAYRVDRIKGATVTKVSFTPRYTVELTTSGPISAPLKHQTTGYGISKISRKIPDRSRSRISSTYGPTYIIECTYCGKKFNRKSYTTSLNAHKDKSGYPCAGRFGYLVDTKY